jgi:hypothetical protein
MVSHYVAEPRWDVHSEHGNFNRRSQRAPRSTILLVRSAIFFYDLLGGALKGVVGDLHHAP